VKRLGVFGGTFDPIHVGHLAAALDALDRLRLDQVLFVPNRQQPLKEEGDASPAVHRQAMLQLAISSQPRFAVSTIELERPGPSYTIDTLRALRTQEPARSIFYFLVGKDVLRDLHRWRDPDGLIEEFRLAVMERPMDVPVDWQAVERRFPTIREHIEWVRVPRLDIQATELRQRVRAGRPITYQVTPSVEAYIGEHSLYRSANQLVLPDRD
jgi:nicotinate-nucleotide adenylyltransferase